MKYIAILAITATLTACTACPTAITAAEAEKAIADGQVVISNDGGKMLTAP